jgi:hypothetical protein
MWGYVIGVDHHRDEFPFSFSAKVKASSFSTNSGTF